MVQPVPPRRFHLTLRSLMIVVAVSALLLYPLSRSIRKWELSRQLRLRAVQEAKLARVLGRKSKAEGLRLMRLAHAKTASRPDEMSRQGPQSPQPTPLGAASSGRRSP